MEFELNRLGCRWSPFEGIRNTMDASPYPATFGILLVDDDVMQNNVRGIARLLSIVFPYAVVQDDWAIKDYTFAHEVGHLFGGRHPAVDEVDLKITGGRGIDGYPDWQTMMGAYDSCPSSDPNYPYCKGYQRLIYFSGSSESAPDGTPLWTDPTRDMKSALNNEGFQEASQLISKRSNNSQWNAQDPCVGGNQ